MANGMIRVADLGANGVNTDKNPLELQDGEFTQAQNASTENENGVSTLKKRPGLIKFSEEASGVVLGGIGIPLSDRLTGTRLFYIGRGEV